MLMISFSPFSRVDLKDIRVDDLDVAEEAVLKLGATSMNTGGQNYRVYLDPQRHPFCLVSW